MADMSQILHRVRDAAWRVRDAERDAQEQADSEYSTTSEKIRFGALARILGQYADSLERTAVDDLWLNEEVGR